MGADVGGLDSSLGLAWHLETEMIFFVLNKFLWFIGNFSGKREERKTERRVRGVEREAAKRERDGEEERDCCWITRLARYRLESRIKIL